MPKLSSSVLYCGVCGCGDSPEKVLLHTEILTFWLRQSQEFRSVFVGKPTFGPEVPFVDGAIPAKTTS